MSIGNQAKPEQMTSEALSPHASVAHAVAQLREGPNVVSKFRRPFPLYTAAPTRSPAGKGKKDSLHKGAAGGSAPAV